ncbi:MAG TPA: nucleoside triphosphatase NudI [Thermoanaerobaculia bacterium]
MSPPTPAPPVSRLIVVPVVRDDGGRVLLCRMPPDRGVFPGQWGLPGGGVEPGERIHDALVREVHEELGVSVLSAKPLFFKDGVHEKTVPGVGRVPLYMVFLLFECRIDASRAILLNDEFSEFAWVEPPRLSEYDLNPATRETFASLGLISREP